MSCLPTFQCVFQLVSNDSGTSGLGYYGYKAYVSEKQIPSAFICAHVARPTQQNGVKDKWVDYGLANELYNESTTCHVQAHIHED